MKVKLDIDVSPEELRRFFGLPDVAPLQQEMMDKIREHFLQGAPGFDPFSLMKPLMPPHLQSLDDWQRYWMSLAETGSDKEKKDKKES